MPITVPQTEINLLSYFQTGDEPTQDQFEELIRTGFYHFNQAEADAAAAASDAADAIATANAIAGLAAHAFGRLRYSVGWHNDREVGCAITTNVTGGQTDVSFTFTTAAADTKYLVFTNVSGVTITSITPFTNKVVVRLNGINVGTLDVLVFS